VHQLLAALGPGALDVVVGQLREVGWPAPEDPDSGGDTELDGRDLICDRLDDEAGWLLKPPIGSSSSMPAGIRRR